MKTAYYNRYKEEVAERTFRIGIYAAIVTTIAIPYFYVLDVRDLELDHSFYWRLLGLIGALMFFVAIFLRDRPQLVIYFHGITIISSLIMMQGIVYQIFTNTSSTTDQEFGATAGSIMVWMAAAVIGAGARWLVALFGFLILIIFSLGLMGADVTTPGLIVTLYLFAIFAITMMYLQERQERNKAIVMYELEEREEKIAQQREDLEKANENLKGFNYAISHDLKGPVRRAYSYTQLLERQLARQDIELKGDYIREIKSSLKLGYQTIEDLLLLSQIGEEAMDWALVDLDVLVNRIWNEQYKAIRAHRVIKFEKEDLGAIKGDEKLIWHVFSNLLSNAIKYTANKEEALIRIERIDEQDARTVCVKDNGAGFDNTFAEQIGKPFKRFHSSEDFEGTGVGLAIVRQIIKLHQGDFWANGKIDAGAAFYCRFPKPQLS
jgi:signal transduction histidine kinase